MNSRSPFGAYVLGQDAGMQFAPLTLPRCHHQTYARRDIIYWLWGGSGIYFLSFLPTTRYMMRPI